MVRHILVAFVTLGSITGWAFAADAPAAAAPPPAQPAANRILRLDGKSAFMLVPDSQSLHSFNTAITIEAWFKPSSFPSDNNAVSSILRKNIQANRENFYLRFRTVRGKPVVEFNPGGTIGTVRAPCEFTTGQWYHLTAVYNGLISAVWVNGKVVKAQLAVGGMRIDDSELCIGKGDPDFSSGEYFHGDLDEIRLWNVARTLEEIRANINKPLTGREPGLVACWTFDDGAAKDLSPNANHGQIDKPAETIESPRPEIPMEKPTASAR